MSNGFRNRAYVSSVLKKSIESMYTYINNINRSVLSMAMKKFPIQKQLCKEINKLHLVMTDLISL